MMAEVGCCIAGQTADICPADKSVLVVLVVLVVVLVVVVLVVGLVLVLVLVLNSVYQLHAPNIYNISNISQLLNSVYQLHVPNLKFSFLSHFFKIRIFMPELHRLCRMVYPNNRKFNSNLFSPLNFQNWSNGSKIRAF